MKNSSGARVEGALRRKTTTEALQRVQVFHRPMFRIGIVSSLILRISPQPCSSSDTARHAAPSLDARTHPQLPLFLSPSLASLAMFCSHFLIPCLRLRLSSTSREPLRAVFRPLGTCGPPTSPFQTHPIRLSAAPTAHGPRTYVPSMCEYTRLYAHTRIPASLRGDTARAIIRD